jgi:hypothetical protein
MRMRKRWLVLLIPLSLPLFFEPYEYPVPGNPALEVRRDQHAAAGRLLEDWQHDYRRILSGGSLYPLPDTDTLLVLPESRQLFSEERRAAFYAWLQQGGSAVVVARPPPRGEDVTSMTPQRWRELDPLLFPLGFSVVHTEAPSPRPRIPDMFMDFMDDAGELFQRLCVNATEEMRAQCEDALCHNNDPMIDSTMQSYPRRLALPAGIALRNIIAGGENLPVPVSPHPLLDEMVLHERAGNEWGDQLLHFGVGRGALTVVTGLDIWDNAQIHLLDHAWFLREITRHAKGVWFVQNLDMPSLARWLWINAWPVLLSGILLLILFLWFRVPRRGPVLAPISRQEVDFLDHLTASSRFLWRTRNRHLMLHALREQVENRMRRHPIPKSLAGRYRYLAERSGLDAEEVEQAFTHNPQTRDELVAMTATLQTLRSSL